jgi:hypothetical protein
MATLVCLGLLPLANGCAVLGYVASVVPGPPTAARYPGLAGQKVAVVTWVDRAASFDYPTLMPDVSTMVQNKLKAQLAADKKTEELQGTTFCDPRKVYRWQRDHPELATKGLNEVAPQLASAMGATRIVYVELSPFSTRDPRTEVLLKGNAGVTIRVAEVNGPTAKVAFDEANVMLEFPDHAPEGVPATDQMTDRYIYAGLVDKVSSEVALRFFTYQEQ